MQEDSVTTVKYTLVPAYWQGSHSKQAGGRQAGMALSIPHNWIFLYPRDVAPGSVVLKTRRESGKHLPLAFLATSAYLENDILIRL